MGGGKVVRLFLKVEGKREQWRTNKNINALFFEMISLLQEFNLLFIIDLFVIRRGGAEAAI